MFFNEVEKSHGSKGGPPVISFESICIKRRIYVKSFFYDCLVKNGALKALSLLCILSLSLCWMSSCSSQKTKEGLRKRITRYWDSRIAGDWKACYDFYIADQKTNLPFNDFLRVREGEVRMKIDSYEIQSVEVNGDKGESHVKFVWKIELPVHIKDRTKSGSGELTQQWLYENGDWFYQPKSDSQP